MTDTEHPPDPLPDPPDTAHVDPADRLLDRPPGPRVPAPQGPAVPDAWSAPVVRVSKRHIWIALAVGIGLLAIGVGIVVTVLPRFLTTPYGTAAGEEQPAAAGEGRRIQATLYYVSEDGGALIEMSRAVLYGATPAEQMRRIVETVVEPPPAGQRSAIPAGTTIRSVFLGSDGQGYVDLGGTIVSGHSGGSLDEALAVYAIVNAVTVNLPAVSAVQILIDGQQVDTLAGHIDLRYPLGKALDWVQKGS